MLYIPKFLKHQKLSVPAGSKQPVATQESSKKPVKPDSGQSHYDSDTEIDTTDDDREVVPTGSKQPVVTQESSKKSVKPDSGLSHYDSDTEVDTTDDEREAEISFLCDTDDLLNDDKPTFSNIPKHINLRKRRIVEAVARPSSRKVSGRTVAGPSSRNVPGGTVAGGREEEFSTQDMLDDM
jgi:hypothetical protein